MQPAKGKATCCEHGGIRPPQPSAVRPLSGIMVIAHVVNGVTLDGDGQGLCLVEEDGPNIMQHFELESASCWKIAPTLTLEHAISH